MGMYVCAGAVAVLVLVLAPGTGPIVASNSLQVLSSLAEVAAAVALIGSWKIGGRALNGWLGVALADRGILSVTHHSIDTLKIGPAGLVEPFGRLVVCVIAAACVYAAMTTSEVDSAFRPLRTIVASTMFGLLGLVALDRTFMDLGTLGTSPMFYRASLGACATVWLAVAVVAHSSVRRGSGATRLWAASYASILGVSSAVDATVVLSHWGTMVEQFAIFVAACLIFVASAWELRCTAHGQDRYALTLRVALNHSEEEMERDRGQVEERLHDLRNAVAALRAADHTLRRYGGRLEADARKRLADALTYELSRLQTLIEPGRRQRTETFLLADALDPVLTAERSCGSVILADLPSTLVQGDRDALAQVVQNLLVNSRRYAPGSPITPSADRVDNRIVMRVSDRGPGIPLEVRDLIFLRGRRGSNSVGTKGSGIGLYVASNLMSDMGGSLTLGDTDDGATFVVEVPLPIGPVTTAKPLEIDLRHTGVLN